MILLGLTGSIAMGKSRAAERFRAFGVPVFDSDAHVHAVMAPGGAAVALVTAAFPGCLGTAQGIDRAALGRMVLGRPAELRRLEAILHPLVGAARERFLRRACRAGAELVVLDVPLLFETGGETRVDAVVVVSAPAHIQRERVLARPGMTTEKFEAILRRQTEDAVKRAKAHYVIDTSLGLDHARERVAYVLEDLKRREATVWRQRKDAARA